MHITLADDHDRLTRDVWEFSTTDDHHRGITLRVESFATQERNTVRHKWRLQNRWHRIPSMNREVNRGKLPGYPPVPEHIRRAAQAQLLASIHHDF